MSPILALPHTTPFGYVQVTILGARLKALYETRAKIHEKRAREAEAAFKKPASAGARVVPMRPRAAVPAEIQHALDFHRPRVERAIDDERRLGDHLALIAELLDPARTYDVSEELLLRLVGPIHPSYLDSIRPEDLEPPVGTVPGAS